MTLWTKLFFLSIFIFCSLPITYAQSPSATPDIAWIQAGELWLAGENIEPFPLAAQNVTFALFSPDGTHLAYLQDQTRLSIIDLSDPLTVAQTLDPSQFPSNTVLGYLAWQGEETLWFNTLQNPASPNDAGGSLLQTNWELWQFNASTGTIADFEADGVAYPSPDGMWVAVVQPGVYEETAGIIQFYNNVSELTGEYEFPAVSSASHLAWLPEIQWVGDAIRLVLPDPDLVYATAPYPPSQVLEISTSGTATAFGDIHIAFPLALAWSADGLQLAYLTPDSNGTDLKFYLYYAVDEPHQIMPLSDLPMGSDVVALHDLFAINAAGERVYFWWNNTYTTMISVWGITQTVTGQYVILEGSPVASITLWENGILPTPEESNAPNLTPIPMSAPFQTLADDLTTFEVQLVGGIQ